MKFILFVTTSFLVLVTAWHSLNQGGSQPPPTSNMTFPPAAVTHRSPDWKAALFYASEPNDYFVLKYPPDWHVMNGPAGNIGLSRSSQCDLAVEAGTPNMPDYLSLGWQMLKTTSIETVTPSGPVSQTQRTFQFRDSQTIVTDISQHNPDAGKAPLALHLVLSKLSRDDECGGDFQAILQTLIIVHPDTK